MKSLLGLVVLIPWVIRPVRYARSIRSIVAGLTLNMMSMAGLALAVGMLVDNSIVVLENIFRHRKEGQDIMESSDSGSKEVSTAIIASTRVKPLVLI